MIREQDLREAIAEMQGERNPNANTCIKLAAYYTILDHITGRTEAEAVSYNPVEYSGGDPYAVDYDGDSEFAQAIRGQDINTLLPVIDELMSILKVAMPRLYDGVMAKL